MKNPLDDVLFDWGGLYRVRDLLRSVGIFGQTGSGKSSGSGKLFARSIIRYRNSGGLWLAAKPEDREDAVRLFREAGRSQDLIIMEPGGEQRCNALEYERKHGADTRDLTQFLMTAQETVSRATGSHDPFWVEQNRRQIHNAIEIVKLGTGRLDPWELQLFINGAASVPADMLTDEWKAGFHHQTIQAAHKAPKTPIQEHDYNLAKQYWLIEIPRLNERTRSSITAGVMGLLHVFNTGIVRHMLATETTVSPLDLERRKWLFIDCPIVAGDATSTFINTSIKYLVERHILRRKAEADAPIIPIFTDEFPKVANKFDIGFLAECRSHKGCLITLAQSVPGMYDAIGKEQAHALWSNQYTKVFHTLGDAESASYASSLLGNYQQLSFGGSESANNSIGQELYGKSGYTANFSVSWQPVLQPSAFLGGMRTGGPPSNMVDGWVVAEGKGRFVSFRQT